MIFINMNRYIYITYYEKLNPTNSIIRKLINSVKQRVPKNEIRNGKFIQTYPVTDKEFSLLQKFKQEGDTLTFHNKN